jgi:hypothetical protein
MTGEVEDLLAIPGTDTECSQPDQTDVAGIK